MKTYFPFAGRDQFRYTLPVCSIANKKRIYQVFISSEDTAMADRIAYAKRIGLKPESVEKDTKTGKTIERWNFDNRYPEWLKPAVLLKALFPDAPKLYEEHEGEYRLKETVKVGDQTHSAQELFDELDEEVVQTAFFDFEMKRTGMSSFLQK